MDVLYQGCQGERGSTNESSLSLMWIKPFMAGGELLFPFLHPQREGGKNRKGIGGGGDRRGGGQGRRRRGGGIWLAGRNYAKIGLKTRTGWLQSFGR